LIVPASSYVPPGGIRLVVALPALNEAATIAKVVEGIPRTLPGVDRVSVLVVDDGSTDDTATLARGAGAEVISLGENRGLGTAFATALDGALRRGASYMVFMDSDGQFDPAGIATLLAPLLEGRADFATCTRFADPKLEPTMPWIKRRGNAWMTALVNRIVRPKRPFTDVSCGFRAYTRDALLLLNLYGRFTYTQETFLDLAAKGLRLTEVSLPVRGVREFGQSRIARSLSRYAWQTSSIIMRSLRDHQPLRVFGTLGGGVVLLGVAQLGFVYLHWLRTTFTSPWQALITTGGACIVTGVILLGIALLADMIGRGRTIQERLLYFARRDYYEREAAKHAAMADSAR